MSKAAESAYKQIRERLIDGTYPPGTKLNESELSKLCGVSRTPIREALRRLAADYFVSIEPNRGAFVIDWKSDDIADIFELRALLEGFAARRAAQRAKDEHLELMQSIVDEIDQISSADEEDSMNNFLELNRRFHDLIFEASGSLRLSEIIARIVQQAVVVRTAAQFTLADMQRSNLYHRELLQAFRLGDSVLAETMMRSHILAAAGRYQDAYFSAQSKSKSTKKKSK